MILHGRLRLPAITPGEMSPEASKLMSRSVSPSRKKKNQDSISDVKKPISRPNLESETPVPSEEVVESAVVSNVENAAEEETPEPTKETSNEPSD